VNAMERPQPMHSRMEIIQHRRTRRRAFWVLFVVAVFAAMTAIGLWSLSEPAATPTLATHRPTRAGAAAATGTTVLVTPTTHATPTTAAPVTTFLPITPGSGAGCTSGVTDGVQWIKYVVKPGDTLSNIANCFDLNGYQSVYAQNEAIIGQNPNLIHPGQTFTITLNNDQMTPSEPVAS
jgi:nucleoid-associated protein YgaU